MKRKRNKKTKAKSEMVIEVFNKDEVFKKLLLKKAEESRAERNG